MSGGCTALVAVVRVLLLAAWALLAHEQVFRVVAEVAGLVACTGKEMPVIMN
jgi:hypothetical protein